MPRRLLLLPFLLFVVELMAYAPSRHRVRLASATDLPGTVESVDRGSAEWYRKFPTVPVECQCSRAGVPASAAPETLLLLLLPVQLLQRMTRIERRCRHKSAPRSTPRCVNNNRIRYDTRC